ncbi:MAG: CRISPR-associated protein Cas4 [Firmicutes bacterium HGW-Firmicutes-14]|nr:MAG: CRISPR-associated protein Cas4 [Firmicutes bacterium HGW-Firmicutes-14]
MSNPSNLHVTGTLIWYYYICHREVWLMARNVVPDQDNPNVDLGRFIQDQTYQREKKEISFGNIKLDIIKKGKDGLVIGEVKKSSKFEASARMQLAFYLSELEKAGLKARGELFFPKEKKREALELNSELRAELDSAVRDILRIAYLDQPPEPMKCKWCKNCAYAEFCWA